MSNEKLLRWETRMAVGRMAYDAGFYSQARRHFQLALQMLEDGGLARNLRARCLQGLAKSLAAQGKYAEAEPLILEALKIDETDSSDIAERAEDYHQLSLLCWRAGRNEESLQYAKTALQLARTAGISAPDEMIAKLLKHHGVLAEESGNINASERYLNEAIQFILASNQLGKNSTIYGDVLLVKVFLLAEQGRYEEAAELYPQAMQIVSINRGLAHPKVEEAMSIFKEMEDAGTVCDADKARKMEEAKDASHHGII